MMEVMTDLREVGSEFLQIEQTEAMLQKRIETLSLQLMRLRTLKGRAGADLRTLLEQLVRSDAPVD